MDKDFYSKYIHIFYGHDSKFVSGMISTLMNEEYGLQPENHFFVAVHKVVYDDLIDVLGDKIVLDESNDNLYKKYSKHCKWIFSHGAPSKIQMITTPRKIMKKIIVRYGGGSRTTHLAPSKNFIKSARNGIKKYFFRKVYESYAAIGIANNVDILDLSHVLKNVKYYPLSYASPEIFYAKKRVKDNNLKYDLGSSKIKVLLGHRGTEENNHIEIMKLLDKFPKDEFDIYIPISYGNNAYIASVKQYIDGKKTENIHVIDSFMPFDQYITLLNAMDIAIFDGFTSYALGNIALLLYFEKTIYLRKSGVISQVLDAEGTPHRYISDIGNMSFEEFSSLEVFDQNWHSDLATRDFQEKIDNWKRIFNDFN